MSDFDYLESVLPGFTEARDIIKAAGDSVFPLQYRGSKFDFYRFANRYRMAARFRAIELDDFTEKTEAGYSALTRVFLVWSVFERYAVLADDPPPYGQLLSLVPRLELARLADHIERHDTDHRLFTFLHDQSLEGNRHFHDRYRGGDRRGVVFCAAAIRHIYVHGHLTAHPNKCTLGVGKFALAWVGDGAQSAIYQQIGMPDPANAAGFSKTNVDLRWYDWPFFGGTGELGLVYAKAQSGFDENGPKAPDADGFAVSLVRTKEGFCDDCDSLHKSSLQVGNGPAKTFTSSFEIFDTAAGTFIRPDPEESWW